MLAREYSPHPQPGEVGFANRYGFGGVAVGGEEKNALGRMTPVGRLGTPEEIAGAAVFIATNGFVNGIDLRVDGGLSAV